MDRPIASTLEELTASLNEIMQRIQKAKNDVAYWADLLEKINAQIHEITSKGQAAIEKTKETNDTSNNEL
jgi:methyl-accepting chemotaxis protein